VTLMGKLNMVHYQPRTLVIMHVLPGAGHFALETNVAEIATLIDAFLAKTGVKNY
jgi:hypothetical protein